MGRKWTDEEKKEFGAKMKALREAKAQDQENKDMVAQSTETDGASVTSGGTTADAETVTGSTNEVSSLDADAQTVSRAEYDTLLMLVKEMAANRSVPAPSQPLDRTDRPYDLNVNNYQNPVERLMQWWTTTPKMTRVASPQNYSLVFKAEIPPAYELRTGGFREQPKFSLDLIELLYDDNGEPLTRVNDAGETIQVRYIKNRFVFFEDKDLALRIARENGVEVNEANPQAFLDDMRFIRCRNWLEERFYPKSAVYNNGVKEEVIAGRVVQIIETSGENSQKMDFNQLNTKF